jgi:hypothetical protein
MPCDGRSASLFTCAFVTGEREGDEKVRISIGCQTAAAGGDHIKGYHRDSLVPKCQVCVTRVLAHKGLLFGRCGYNCSCPESIHRHFGGVGISLPLHDYRFDSYFIPGLIIAVSGVGEITCCTVCSFWSKRQTKGQHICPTIFMDWQTGHSVWAADNASNREPGRVAC